MAYPKKNIKINSNCLKFVNIIFFLRKNKKSFMFVRTAKNITNTAAKFYSLQTVLQIVQNIYFSAKHSRLYKEVGSNSHIKQPTFKSCKFFKISKFPNYKESQRVFFCYNEPVQCSTHI